jgi:hypothetical protein
MVAAAESNLCSPFRFFKLLILTSEENAKRPIQAYPSYNYHTVLLLKKRASGHFSPVNLCLTLTSLI